MIEWRWKTFEELKTTELYEIIALRERVFIVEQDCAYLDCDGFDPRAWHLAGYLDGRLSAYLRVFPAGVKFAEVSFGRVVTAPEHRGAGFGRALTTQGLLKIRDLFGEVPVRISAQAYLEGFYRGFGFVRQGENYLEDGIPHVEMLRK